MMKATPQKAHAFKNNVYSFACDCLHFIHLSNITFTKIGTGSAWRQYPQVSLSAIDFSRITNVS